MPSYNRERKDPDEERKRGRERMRESSERLNKLAAENVKAGVAERLGKR